MVKALVQMKEDISIVMKQWIGAMKRQMLANGGAKYDISVDNLLNIVEVLKWTVRIKLGTFVIRAKKFIIFLIFIKMPSKMDAGWWWFS